MSARAPSGPSPRHYSRRRNSSSAILVAQARAERAPAPSRRSTPNGQRRQQMRRVDWRQRRPSSAVDQRQAHVCASARAVIAPCSPLTPADSSGYTFAARRPRAACVISTRCRVLRRYATRSLQRRSATPRTSPSSATSPPMRQHLGPSRRDEQEAIGESVRRGRSPARSARSSSSVTCPTMPICAPVAVIGSFLVSVRRSPESHPSRSVADNVLPWLLRSSQHAGEFGLDYKQALVRHALVVRSR